MLCRERLAECASYFITYGSLHVIVHINCKHTTPQRLLVTIYPHRASSKLNYFGIVIWQPWLDNFE